MTQPFLIWAAGGMHLLTIVDAVIGKALQNRGYEVFAIVCDGTYKACILRNISVGAPIETWGNKGTNEYGTSCEECKRKNAYPFIDLKIPFAFMSDFINQKELLHLRNLSRNKDISTVIDLEKHVKSSVTRFLQGEDLNHYPEKDKLFAEYSFSAYVSSELIKNITKIFKPFKILMSHGIYVDWGIVLEYSLKNNIPVIIWQEGYFKSFFYFYSPSDIYHTHPFTCKNLSWQKKSQEALTPIKQQRIEKYLLDRYVNSLCMDLKTLPSIKKSNLDFLGTDKPIWCLFAHLTWDASGERTKKIYPSYADWIIETYKIIKDIKDVFWIIKPHPAEKWYQTKVGIEELIRKSFSDMPDNILILKPDIEINPLLLYKRINGAITIAGTSGIESAYHGKPVITAGESYYSDKGFTFDAKTVHEYRDLLHQSSKIPELPISQKELAQKYMYLCAIEKQIPLEIFFDSEKNFIHYQRNKQHLLEPGKDPFVDFICDRIIDGEDFILDEVLVQQAIRFKETKMYHKKTYTIAETLPSSKFENLTNLLNQIVLAIETKDIKTAISLINEIFTNYSELLNNKQKQDLANTLTYLHGIANLL